jgi:hypothetical protein
MLASDLDVVCLSHLRWDWMWQRPQHLLSRCARSRRVFYVQEAEADGTTRLEVERTESGVYAVTPHVPDNLEATLPSGTAGARINVWAVSDDCCIPTSGFATSPGFSATSVTARG